MCLSMSHPCQTLFLQLHGCSLERELQVKRIQAIFSISIYRNPYCFHTSWRKRHSYLHRPPQLTALFQHPLHSPLNRSVILGDSHGRGRALRVMDGLGGDYTPGECKAPTLPCDKSTVLPHLTVHPLLSLPGIILL